MQTTTTAAPSPENAEAKKLESLQSKHVRLTVELKNLYATHMQNFGRLEKSIASTRELNTSHEAITTELDVNRILLSQHTAHEEELLEIVRAQKEQTDQLNELKNSTQSLEEKSSALDKENSELSGKPLLDIQLLAAQSENDRLTKELNNPVVLIAGNVGAETNIMINPAIKKSPEENFLQHIVDNLPGLPFKLLLAAISFGICIYSILVLASISKVTMTLQNNEGQSEETQFGRNFIAGVTTAVSALMTFGLIYAGHKNRQVREKANELLNAPEENHAPSSGTTPTTTTTTYTALPQA